MTSSSVAGPSSSTQNGSSSSNKRARPAGDVDQEFVYDPRQDPNDRRKVRSEYRALIAQAEEAKKDSSLKPQDLLTLIQRADTLHDKVVAPSESILDTRTLTSVSEMGARMAKKMKLNTDAFDTNEFVTRLARYLGGEALPVRAVGAETATAQNSDDDEENDTSNVDAWDWNKLATLAAGYSRRAVTIDFLLGPLEIVVKERKAPTQRRVEEHAERSAPKQLRQQDLQTNAESDTAAQVHKVAKLLRQQGQNGVNLFHFVADPDSFTNTIENLFHVSFLIREGKAGISTDDEGNAILSK